MSYSIEPAYVVHHELMRLIIKAGSDPVNKWFFTDSAFCPETQLSCIPNTWKNEDFVVISNNEILGYFEAHWSKPLNIINSFRLLLFKKNKANSVARALFQYFDYLFVCRGCKAFNWTVAEKNHHAYKIYEKFIKNYFGHRVGIRHNGQMAYNGEISDIYLYEITDQEYFKWKNLR